MMEAIDKVSGADFFAGMKGNVKVMHGFTHGGREQLGRRFDAEGNLRANYSDDEKKEVVRATTATFVLLTSIFHKVLLDDPTQDIQTAVLNEKFVELYGAAQTT